MIQVVVGIVCFLVAQFAMNYLQFLLHLDETRLPLALRLGVPTGISAVVSLIVSRVVIARARGDELGFSSRHVRELPIGFLLGALLISLVMAVLLISGAWSFDSTVPTAPVRELVASFIGFALVGLGEEILFRGVFFKAFEEWLGTAGALAITSLFFGVAHLMNPNSSLLAAVAIAIEAGLLLGAAFLVSRSLWLPIGLHWAWNFTLGSVFGAPVSGQILPSLLHGHSNGLLFLNGGTWGPEAGLAAFVLCTACGIALLLRARSRTEWIPLRKPAPEPAQLPG
ncbi:MAG: CPBP family intramembrane glutamic endopeptidase [Myxococcaceae bacterium]